MKHWKALAVSLAISLGTAGLTALLTKNAMKVYQALNQPKLAPPGWLFPPVWTLLFLLMGISAWMVWKTASSRLPGAVGVRAPAGGERRLVTHIFPGAKVLGGACGAGAAGSADSADDLAVLSGSPCCRLAAGALFSVGIFCRVSQSYGGPAQPVKGGEPAG